MERRDPAIDFPIGRARPVGKRWQNCEDCLMRPRIKGYAVCRICARRREQESGR